MNNYSEETYLNHPTFGLLFRVCLVRDNQELFTTLYAQRLFFLVTTNANGLNFDIVSRSDARLLVETRLRKLRMNQLNFEHRQLQDIYERTFQ
ncbi:MAG: transcriptional coactivator PipX [Xenococcaceae cyanobacterium]